MGLSEFARYGSAANKVKAAIENSMVSHAYIIEAEANVDKIGFAKAFVEAVLCAEKPGEGCGYCANCRKIENGNYEDLYMIEPEGKIGTNQSIKVAQIEALQERLKVKPSGGDRNIAIISGADNMVPQAQSKLLKTLEEPSVGTIIMLLSENSDSLLSTINSRCVKLRLISEYGDNRGFEDSPMLALAEKILVMISSKSFFFDIKRELEGNIKSKEDAYAFLDGMEGILGAYLRKEREDVYFTVKKSVKAIDLVENARRALQQNAIFKYTVKNLAVKLEDI